MTKTRKDYEKIEREWKSKSQRKLKQSEYTISKKNTNVATLNLEKNEIFRILTFLNLC